MDERVCWLCGRNGNGDPLECHHIFGGAMRKKSEKYGLKVYLCGIAAIGTGRNQYIGTPKQCFHSINGVKEKQ